MQNLKISKFPLYWFITILSVAPQSLLAQELPIGYTSYYENSCKSMSFINSLEISEPSAWKLSKYGATIISPLNPDSIKVSFPENKGFLKNLILGEYILEFEFRVIDHDTTPGSGFCLLSPVKSCDTYYVLSFSNDSLRFYYADSGNISLLNSKKSEIDTDEWNKVRVERDILKRKIRLILSGKTTQDISFSDRRLVMGYLGFGTQNVNSAVRNIRIWAPTAIQDEMIECE